MCLPFGCVNSVCLLSGHVMSVCLLSGHVMSVCLLSGHVMSVCLLSGHLPWAVIVVFEWSSLIEDRQRSSLIFGMKLRNRPLHSFLLRW